MTIQTSEWLFYVLLTARSYGDVDLGLKPIWKAWEAWDRTHHPWVTDRNSATGPFNSSSNQNYVDTKFSCLKYDLQCTFTESDKTYNTTMYVRPAKTLVSLCIDPLDKASFLDSPVQRRCILYDQWSVWSECAVAVGLFIPLWIAQLSKVNTISGCFYQNVQLADWHESSLVAPLKTFC